MVKRHRFVRQLALLWLSGSCALEGLACSSFASENDRAAADLGVEPSLPVSSAWDCTTNTNTEVRDPFVYSEATSLALSIQVIDIFTRSVPPNLKVRACLITDLECERPISADLSADADGIVTVPLAVGVSGFLELTADGVAPEVFVLPGPLSLELVTLLRSRPLILVSTGDAGSTLPIRAQATPDTGILTITVFDCDGKGAAGVRLEVDAQTVPYSIIDGLPILNERTTTSNAVVGFINVMPGVTVVRGYRADTGQIVGRVAVPVRAGWDTLAYMLPEPGLVP